MSEENTKQNDIKDSEINSEETPVTEDTAEDSSVSEVTESATEAEAAADPEPPVKRITFKDRINSAEAAVTAFLAENNVMARLIGLFMIFSSMMFTGNYRKEDRIKVFNVNFGENSTDINDWQNFCNSVSIGKLGAFIVILFAAVSLIQHFIPKLKKVNIDGYILTAGVMMFGICALWRNDSNSFFSVYSFGITAVSLVLLACFLKTDGFDELRKIPRRALFVILVILACGVGAYVAWTTICKHRIFHTAVFDLGIFAQMYHSIITDFTQNTTCERGYVLSHFAVHFSPVYYLLAPLYYFFPSPETLLASQAVLAVSGFIPLWLICRKYNFSDISSFLFTLVYIFSVSVISPCYYEFHENAFLPPFLMWFFYAVEKDRKVLMYVFMVLILMVKEDAALYVMCISLYLVFSGKNRKHGFIMFCLTAALFVNVLSLMSKYGEGAMTSRTFGNLMQNYDSGFGEVIKTVLTNPMYFIQQCFANNKLEKFVFICVMLMPLLFMPFMTRKPSRLLLVVPFLVMNLASGYPYASKFDFQYVFGTSVCLIYAALINVADFDKKTSRMIIPLMTAASVLIFTANVTNKLYYPEVYKGFKENNDIKDSYCRSIPEDASLLTTSFLIPHCTNRDELYILDENSSVNPDTCDFVMFEDGNDDWKINKREMLEEEGYELWVEEKDLLIIYKSPDYVTGN